MGIWDFTNALTLFSASLSLFLISYDLNSVGSQQSTIAMRSYHSEVAT